jgi:hypothetical protein
MAFSVGVFIHPQLHAWSIVVTFTFGLFIHPWLHA